MKFKSSSINFFTNGSSQKNLEHDQNTDFINIFHFYMKYVAIWGY
jgi:hypothetical protein